MKSILLSLLLISSVFLGTSSLGAEPAAMSASAKSHASSATASTACPANMVCLTILEMAEIRQAQEMQTLEVAELQYQVVKYKSLLKRSGRVFAQAGMEYLPNEDESIQPYLIGGFNFGRMSIWGGAFGDSPVFGLGWNF